MSEIKIHILHTGSVCVSPYLPYGGEHCNIIKASGIFGKKSDRLWLPVSCYLIEHPKGKVLVDTGWHRDMSPNGVFDKKAQIKSLGSPILYLVNQGVLEKGAAINEQLNEMGIKTADLDYVVVTHLDCDHANGLEQVADAGNIMVAADEVKCAEKNSAVRYKKKWWAKVSFTEYQWNGNEGPAEKSYDLFGDGSIMLINIPGHSDGQVAVKIRNNEGKYVLLFADGGYSAKSWKEMITSGISLDKKMQKKSLEWIRKQSLSKDCVESLANHDIDVVPHVILL